ncbi:MAG: tryptophan-rich sensory protein [candidate division Zixibacteria bacterium]|nr:tryptophan-rich sensory protein [candidate division Zixibacteria bacterium]
MNFDQKTRSRLFRSILGLLLWLTVCYSIAFWGMQYPIGQWYEELKKPPLTPPGIVFAPVWTVLYTLMAVAAWRIWHKYRFHRAPYALLAFLFQLFLNGMWSYLFFGKQSPGFALIDLVLLWLAILTTIILFWKRSQLSALLMIPYLAWVSFAGYLNFSVWYLNR